MPRPAACLFDLDGLLLDTEPLHAQAWQEAASHFGRPLAQAELLSLRGRRRQDCVRQVLGWIAETSTSPPTAPELLAVRQPLAEALLVLAPPMPGAEELVCRCNHKGIPMALATSSSGDAVALKTAPTPGWRRSPRGCSVMTRAWALASRRRMCICWRRNGWG